jgi:hypothetical protein
VEEQTLDINGKESIPAERLTFSSNMKDAHVIGSLQKAHEENLFNAESGLTQSHSEQIFKKISNISAPFRAKLMVKNSVGKLKPLISL